MTAPRLTADARRLSILLPISLAVIEAKAMEQQGRIRGVVLCAECSCAVGYVYNQQTKALELVWSKCECGRAA